MTPEWRAKVAALIDQSGMSRLEFAKLCKTSGPSLSRLLRGQTATSHLVPVINKILGIGPEVDVEDEDTRRWLQYFLDTPPEFRPQALQIVEAFHAALKKRS